MAELQIKPMAYAVLPDFLSEKQLSEHHDVLYGGYVKKANQIRTELTTVDLESANATYSSLRSLKDAETFAVNGIRLHEGYFDNMAVPGQSAAGKLLAQIEKDFGSYEAFEKMFKACGLACRAWVVLAWDLEEERLHIYAADSHDDGAVWGAIPLLCLDVYEHAYFLDYATARKKYIEGFMQHINWEVVAAKAEKWVK